MDEYELYQSGMSITEVSEELNIPKSTIRFRFHKRGILRTRHEGIILAAKKGGMARGHNKGRIFSKEWRENISKGKILYGDKHARGVSKKPSGYIEITRGENKGRYVYVVVMEEYIGRKVYSYECVHHINGIRDDNNIENLQLMTKSEHARWHRLHEKKRERNKKGQFTNGK